MKVLGRDESQGDRIVARSASMRARRTAEEQSAAEGSAPPPESGDGVSGPLPEPAEERIEAESPTDLSRRDFGAILVRSAKESMDDHITNLAQAIAYNAFLAIPSGLLVALGIFATVAGPDAAPRLLAHLDGVVPKSAIDLLTGPLASVAQKNSGGVVLIVVGALLALWSLTGAMQTVMWALNMAYEREETRNFLKMRLTALAMIFCSLLAFLLVFGLLVLGPVLSGWVGDAIGYPTETAWIWWVAQWPILFLGLFACFAAILYLGPNVDLPRYRFFTPGAVVAVVVWLIASGAFAFYVSNFGSYNKTWGALSAAIIMLTWLWLSALALLFGAEINAEAERSRELRRGEPAQERLQAPARA